MNITDLAIARPVAAWMAMAAVLLFGVLAMTRMGVSQFPDVDKPTITANFTYDGAAPEIMEAEIADPIEEALTQVEGVTEVRSTCRKGSAAITIELSIARDVDAALQEVQTRIAQAQRRLPDGIDPPVVSKQNPEDQPIMWLSVAGTRSPQELADFARYRLKERLQGVPGVGEIVLGGLRNREVRIWLRSDDLDRYGLAAGEVAAALRGAHVELPAGALKGGGREVSVRVIGEAAKLDDYRALVVGGAPDAPVRLDQVALVEDGFEDETRRNRVGGVPAQGLGVRKQRGANAVEVGAGVRAVIDELRQSAPEGLEIGVNFDSTPFIAESVHELEMEILRAILLTALVCWLFLRSFSSTLNVLLAIPMSLLGAIAVCAALGWTLNTFTLLALGLSVGIVVDDAILVLESIVKRREAGDDARTAASRGTREIAFAALAASVAVIAIVLPVVFMRGVVGRYFLQFGIVLSLAVLFSYIEAVTIAPARCAQILGHTGRGGRIGRAIDAGLGWIERLYARLLAVALRAPLLTTVIAVVLAIGGLWIGLRGAPALGIAAIPSEFVPSQDQGRLRITLTMPVGSELDEVDKLSRRAEAYLAGRPEIARTYVAIGGFGGNSGNSTSMLLTLAPREQRPPLDAVMAMLRKEFSGYAGVRARIEDPSREGVGGSSGAFAIEFALVGADWDQLIEASARTMEQLRESGVAVDIDSDYQLGVPELRIIPDRARCADRGVAISDVASTISLLIGGERLGRFSMGSRRLDVRAQLVAAGRRAPEDLARLRVRGGDGGLVPLSDLVTTEERPALQAITRRDRQRAITIKANVAPGHGQGEAIGVVGELAKGLPAGVSLKLGGASSAFGDAFADLGLVFLLGVAVAYMVLAAQFNSFLHPVTVLSILPMSLAGGILALSLGGFSLNLFSAIGLILLMGLAKKNSIVLVDVAARLREEGMDPVAAALRAGALRLRPILMTSVATIAGALPIAFGTGPGAELRSPMAVAVIGGLFVATSLSLLAVPAFWVCLERLRTRVSAALARRRAGAAPEPTGPAPAGHKPESSA